MPEGNLSPTQFAILEVLWDMGEPGGTVTQIWEKVSECKPVVRSTVLNLVDRLEKRGWLQRTEVKGLLHYWPTANRKEVERQVTKDLVEGYFGGSASSLVMSLLGSSHLTQEDLRRLRRLLDEAANEGDHE